MKYNNLSVGFINFKLKHNYIYNYLLSESVTFYRKSIIMNIKLNN